MPRTTTTTNPKRSLLQRLRLGQSNPTNPLEQNGTARTKRIGFPGDFMHWLGIGPDALSSSNESITTHFLSYADANGDAFIPFRKVPDNDSKQTGQPQNRCVDREQFGRLIADTVNYAVSVQSECMIHQLDESHEPLKNEWRNQLYSRLNALTRIFASSDLDGIVFLQGYEPTNALARIAAQSMNIPYVALENTALSNKMIWDHLSGITTNRNQAANYFWKHRDWISQETADDFCNRLINNTRLLKSSEHTSPLSGKPFQNSKPMVLYLGQVYTDSSILFGLNRWESPEQNIFEVARWCEENDHHLVVKLHPKECSGVNPIDCAAYRCLTARKIKAHTQLAQCLNENQFEVDDDNRFDTYELIESSKFCVTMNSQSGLEAAIRNRPAVTCGNAFYGNLGFTIDANSPASLAGALETAAEVGKNGSNRQAEWTNLARVFTYIFFEKYCRPKTVTGLRQLIEEIFP